MIEIRDIQFQYPKAQSPVFDGFNLTFRDGFVYGLLGRNGVGKSTLLHTVMGLLRPRRGSITLDGRDARQRRADVLADCFIVAEEFELPACKLNQYVRLTAPFYPNFSEEELSRNLALLDIAGNPDLTRLSMGQRKKVMISFALAANTKYLIMDEPTNGLDIPAKEQFRRTVAASRRPGRTIIISTHQVADIESLLDRVVIIEHNRVMLEATVADICHKLSFGVNQPEALYSMPFAGGSYTIARNTTGQPSAMRLDLLFNAVILNPQIKQIIEQ